MTKPHLFAAALLCCAAFVPAAAEAHYCWHVSVYCWRVPVVVFDEELPAIEVAPNIYVSGEPAGRRVFPYASRRAYRAAHRYYRSYVHSDWNAGALIDQTIAADAEIRTIGPDQIEIRLHRRHPRQ